MKKRATIFASFTMSVMFLFGGVSCGKTALPKEAAMRGDGVQTEKREAGASMAATQLAASQEQNISDLVDFVVEVESGRDIRILQLTDTQLIDRSKGRSAMRRGDDTTPVTDAELYENCFHYIEGAIEKTDPDLILLTGDNVYGEYDDDGSLLIKLVEYMDSFDIPWAPIFGNHENESIKGVTWQCQQFIDAENCLFKRGNLTGNGNYSIGLVQDSVLEKVVYMMDSNGCWNGYEWTSGTADDPARQNYNQGEKIKTTFGFGDDQLEWLKTSYEKIDATLSYEVSTIVAFHIMIKEFNIAAYESGYESDLSGNNLHYEIGVDVLSSNGDFGYKGAHGEGMDGGELWGILKANNCDGVFVGHTHENSSSILYDGIRLTFGLKTGRYDTHLADRLGGTLITVKQSDSSIKVKHIYVK